MEKTFGIIKPDAVAAGYTGAIIELIERNKFAILRMQKVQLTRSQAENFYAIHKEKPFFNELVSFIISGPVVILALEQNNAIQNWRDLMGTTNPEKAAPGTLRKMFGTSIGTNAVHGSDSSETARIELGSFFPDIV